MGGWLFDFYIVDVASTCESHQLSVCTHEVSCLFVLTKRATNCLAHNLAKIEGDVDSLLLWEGHFLFYDVSYFGKAN